MQSINGFHFDDEFCQFVNHELLTDSGSKADFWDQFTSLLQVTGKQSPVTDSVESSDVSLLNARYALKAINARWGSLYSALYHEKAIPHSAGLRTGQRLNIARASRVIDYARQFLDAAFPLSEGSHKDAVSYLIYYQNLMVTLADGSTVGLQTPGHFVAKSGPKDNPEAIILRNTDVHIEIRFNRNGVVGKRDIATIDDILVEAPARTVLSCKADSITDKCEILRNVDALAKGRLNVRYVRDGKTLTRRLNRNSEFTARDGDSYFVTGCNPVVLSLHSATTCPAVSDTQDNPLPDAVVNAALFSLLGLQGNHAKLTLMTTDSGTYELVKPVIDSVNTNNDSSVPQVELISNHQIPPGNTADTTQHQDNRLPWARIAEEDLKDTSIISTQNTAVLDAIQHSYLPH